MLPARASLPSDTDREELRGGPRFGFSAVLGKDGKFQGTVLGAPAEAPAAVLDTRRAPSWAIVRPGERPEAAARRDQGALVDEIQGDGDAEGAVYAFGDKDRRALAAEVRRRGLLLGDADPEPADLAALAVPAAAPPPPAVPVLPPGLPEPRPRPPPEERDSGVETLTHAGDPRGAPRPDRALADLFADADAGDAAPLARDASTALYVSEQMTRALRAAVTYTGMDAVLADAPPDVLEVTVMEPRPVAPHLWPALDALLARDANPAAVAEKLVEPALRRANVDRVSADEVVQTVRAKAEAHRADVLRALAVSVRRVAAEAAMSLSRDPTSFDPTRGTVFMGETVTAASIETALLVVLDQLARGGSVWASRKDIERALKTVPAVAEEVARVRVAVVVPPRPSVRGRSRASQGTSAPRPVRSRVSGHLARGSQRPAAPPPPASPAVREEARDPPRRGKDVALPTLRVGRARERVPEALAAEPRHAVYVLAWGVAQALGGKPAPKEAAALLALSAELEETVGAPVTNVAPFALALAEAVPAAAAAVREFRDAFLLPDLEKVRRDKETLQQLRRAMRDADLGEPEGEADLPPPDVEDA